MKKFRKYAKLDNVCYDVRGPVVRSQPHDRKRH